MNEANEFLSNFSKDCVLIVLRNFIKGNFSEHDVYSIAKTYKVDFFILKDEAFDWDKAYEWAALINLERFV